MKQRFISSSNRSLPHRVARDKEVDLMSSSPSDRDLTPKSRTASRGWVCFILLISIFLSSCTESFSDRCRREAKEYTERQCPRLVDKCIVMDSMTYEDEPQGFTYHQTVRGELDNKELLTPEALSSFQEQLLASIRKDINLRRFKERGFTFTYRYTSASTGDLFTEVSFGPEDYTN